MGWMLCLKASISKTSLVYIHTVTVPLQFPHVVAVLFLSVRLDLKEVFVFILSTCFMGITLFISQYHTYLVFNLSQQANHPWAIQTRLWKEKKKKNQ